MKERNTERKKQEEAHNSQSVNRFFQKKTTMFFSKRRPFIQRALFFITIFFTAAYSSTLNLSISSYPSRLNPLLATDTASSEIADWIFSSLLKYDKDANIVGDLADKFYFKDDKTLIFKLHDNLFWHDGIKITSKDVIFTYNTIISPNIFTPYTSTFRTVKSVKAIDELTIEVKYKEPYFKALETWMMGILPSHILKNEKDLMTSSFNQKPIGSNSYTIDGFEISKNIELFAYKNYKPHKPNIDKVIYHYVQDPSTEFLMLKSFQLDIGSLTPLQHDRQIDDSFKEHYNIISESSKSYTYLGFNLKKEPFNNPKLREAINLAIDKQELVDILFFGHGELCNGPFLKGSIGFNETVTAKKQDLKKAKELLKELGFNEKNPLKFTITTNSNNPIRKYTAEIIQHQLKKAGIEVKIKIMEWQAFLNKAVHARDFDLILLGWALPLMPDPYSAWHSESDKKGGFNFIGYKNNEVDKLIKESEAIVDRKKLDINFKKIFELIVNDNPYIFLYIPSSITAISKNISPIEPSTIGIMHNKIEWIKE